VIAGVGGAGHDPPAGAAPTGCSADRGADALACGWGDDLLNAGTGDDALDGGTGAEICNVGGDIDTAARCERLVFIP
jgi:hypothetical protein